MTLRSGAFILLVSSLSLAAGSNLDLDVDLDPGRPYDFIKVPNDNPTGGGRRGAESGDQGGNTPQPQSGGPGKSVVEGEEEKKKQPPPAAPFPLPGSKVPNTWDWQQHVAWTPKDDLVEWKENDDQGNPVATGKREEDEEEDPFAGGKDVWNMKKYPPTVPYDLYVYCLTRFMQVQLHGAQVSWEERAQFLIELGYPGYYAATAVKNEGDIKKMSAPILRSVGPMVKNPPTKPNGEIAQRVYMDLLLKYPYVPGFGDYILNEPSGKTLPVLLHIIKNVKHPFLLRNAVFILRCFNNREIVDPLMALLQKTKDPVIRNRCIIALARWGPPTLAEWCSKRLGGNDGFRTLAVWAIGRVALVSSTGKDVVKRVLSATRKGMDKHGEFLLSAIPALGQIGRYESGETRDKIEKLLLMLLRYCDMVKNPPSRGGSQGRGGAMKEFPDPPRVRAKILMQRVKMALAMMGRKAELNWLDEQSTQDIHITSRVLFEEVKRIIANKE